jgi:hypothetical protein
MDGLMFSPAPVPSSSSSTLGRTMCTIAVLRGHASTSRVALHSSV